MAGNVVHIGGGGRPPKPTEAKRLAGTLRPGRVNPAEPKVEACPMPAPPEEWTEQEQAVWTRIAGVIDPLRVATSSDVEAFRQLVQAVAICEQAQASYRRTGCAPLVTEEGSQKQMVTKRAPELDIIKEFSKLVALWSTRFGLSPSDRARVSALDSDKAAADPLAEFGP